MPDAAKVLVPVIDGSPTSSGERERQQPVHASLASDRASASMTLDRRLTGRRAEPEPHLVEQPPSSRRS
jgi:hypothetical protein